MVQPLLRLLSIINWIDVRIDSRASTDGLQQALGMFFLRLMLLRSLNAGRSYITGDRK